MAHTVAMALLALSLNSIPESSDQDSTGGSRQNEDLQVIRQNMHEVENCYDRARSRSPKLQGEVFVEWDITSGGDVVKAQATNNTTGDKDLAECIVRAVKYWRFPSRDISTPFHMSHPFRFMAAQ